MQRLLQYENLLLMNLHYSDLCVLKICSTSITKIVLHYYKAKITRYYHHSFLYSRGNAYLCARKKGAHYND